MLQAVVFDMDGVIIESEHVWREVEIEEFAKIGVTVTNQDMMKLTGLRSDLLIDTVYKRSPWVGKTKKELDKDIKTGFLKGIENISKPMPGVIKLLEELSLRRMPLAVCSSSARYVIEFVLNKFNIRNNFEHIVSTEEIHYAKPHPEAYIKAAELLGVDILQTVIIEDSLTGTIAAKASRAKVVAVPDKNCEKRSKFDFCDLIVSSLEELNYEKLNALLV